MTKLSKWLKGNLKDNVKETFEATIEHLLKLKPPIKKGNKRQALMSSLQALMKNDESVREEYESLNAWVNVNNSEKEKEKNLKIVDKEHQAMFKKARVVQYNISYGAGSTQMQNSNNITSEHEVSTDIKEAQEINPLNGQKVKEEKEDNLLSRIPHKFSFSASKQGSYVEPILEHVEKALFRFVVKNRDYIPSDTVKEFALKCNPPAKY
ncbi:14764_t:CDS:1 [Entrophospora sp. SA101]|nr:3224_t:CDS:1 [Entrophospora sp. SA101]CAJ0848892.1 8958_t:CDS:1 [Entrophospora sp. SA101]CAJ0877124.1 4521_t:CDS:1 [Entrophospora sp. SA101]CAJ0909508.1 14764_t:CDS:1 [Entrophospora sp. SA101]